MKVCKDSQHLIYKNRHPTWNFCPICAWPLKHTRHLEDNNNEKYNPKKRIRTRGRYAYE
jgi:hypothetical protein